MSKYGLDGDLPALALPKQKPARPKPEPETLARAKAKARQQGFEDRAPAETPERAPRKPGPKKTEPSYTITVRGPARVLDRFREYCEAHPSYWHAIEKLLDE